MEALLYSRLPDQNVKCNLCHHRCVISNGNCGICEVRENIDGVLYARTFNRAISTRVDPIEKKPLYHYVSGTRTYSIATVGCNMECKWCQNHDISQYPKKHKTIIGRNITPKEHVVNAIRLKCPSISYTYTEPTIYFEYALETMKLAKEQGLRNIWVSNGYMTPEAIDMMLPYLDAINIDYKGSGNKIYETYCLGTSKWVLQNIKRFHQEGIHIEITTLIVPGVNDGVEQINKLIQDVVSVSTTIPWHISRFFPAYKMNHVAPTNIDTMYHIQQLAQEAGIETIHLGNV